VSPYLIGGKRMAQILKKPTVVDFIDTAMMNGELGLGMEEAVVGSTSSLVGKTLVESHIRQDFGVIIVAIKKPSNEMIFNPVSTEKLETGDTIVVIGKKGDLERMNSVLAE
jgi:voltage-gated potassium channel